MKDALKYGLIETIGVTLFASEGLFVKDIELHPFVNVLLAYTVYAVISFIVLTFQGKMNWDFAKQISEPKFLILNMFNIIRTGGLFVGFKLLPVSFAIVIKMMSPAFILVADSLLNNKPMNVLEKVGIAASILFMGLVYKKPIGAAMSNLSMKFLVGVLGVLLYNTLNAYNVIKLPEYVTDKNPHEEVFLSTGISFVTLATIFLGVVASGSKLFGKLEHFNMLKMIGVFIMTCYVGMSLTYAADNHLPANVFSILQYSQLALAFVIGYFFEGEKFPPSRILFVVCLIASIFLIQFGSDRTKPVKKDKRKITLNTMLRYEDKDKKKA